MNASAEARVGETTSRSLEELDLQLGALIQKLRNVALELRGVMGVGKKYNLTFDKSKYLLYPHIALRL